MKASFTTNIQDVLSAFQSINQSKDKDISGLAPLLLFALASDKSSRVAILPPTVGWFALTVDSESKVAKGAKLQVLGTNADGYLVLSLLHGKKSSQLCELRRGEFARFTFENENSVATLSYESDSVDISVNTESCQQFSKNIITFSGQVPKSKIGRGESVARPLDDKGVNRVYLDHSLVNARGERAPVSFARTEHKIKTTYPKHAHIDDNVRFICSGVYRFTIFHPETDTVIHQCEVVSGDTIQVPAGYAYVEEVLEPGVVINGRTWSRLHYRVDTTAKLRGSTDVTLSLGLLE